MVSSSMSEKSSLSSKMGNWFRHILSCCDRDEEEERPALQISAPTNFRREDISIPGLDPDKQAFIRAKAIQDAQRMYSHLQPLRSSPSDHFASPQSPSAPILPSYQDFTTPRSAPAPSPSPRNGYHGRRPSAGGLAERVKKHSRKISNSLTGGNIKSPVGYHEMNGAGDLEWEDSKYEMRALMEPGSRTRTLVGTPPPLLQGKVSGEGFSSVSGSEMGDVDSGKGMRI